MERNGFVKALKQELARLQEDRRAFDLKVNTVKQLLRFYGENQKIITSTDSLLTGEFPKLKQADAAYHILKQIGEPLHIQELVVAMTERGMRFRARRPSPSVASALLRDDRFINKGKNTFALIEWEKKNAPKPE